MSHTEVLKYLRNKRVPVATAKEVEKVLGMGHSTARKNLTTLYKRDLAERNESDTLAGNNHPLIYYRLTEKGLNHEIVQTSFHI